MKRIAAKTLWLGSHAISNPVISIEGGRVLDIHSRDEIANSVIDYDFADGTITPALCDIHFHGIAGHDVMNATPEALDDIACHLARVGVSRFLPTTVTASIDTTLFALDRIANFVMSLPSAGRARAVGIHIEGPFLSHGKRGMHPAEHLQVPSPDLLDRLWEAARGQIRLMTIAPELPGAIETIKHAASLGIRCSMGHSMATRDEALAGLQSGIISATHTFNAMRSLDHREPGILGVVLDSDDLYADLICDGHHVAPEGVRLWLKAKGPERAILITDCLSAAGMPDGVYKTGDTMVRVEGDACRTDTGVLAGSVITLDRAVDNLQRITGVQTGVASLLASRNPSKMLGLPHVLEIGEEADFVVRGPGDVEKHIFLRGSLVD